jgi:ketosteroid isomerase-like protein
MSYLQKATEMYKMIEEGKSMEALEKFYADGVVVIESSGEARQGKDSQRKALQEWYAMVKEMHGSGVRSITANEETATTSVESWVEATFADGKRSLMEEVAIQKWKGDQIIHERFYYFVPAEMQQ